jgi:hypothetical protein
MAYFTAKDIANTLEFLQEGAVAMDRFTEIVEEKRSTFFGQEKTFRFSDRLSLKRYTFHNHKAAMKQRRILMIRNPTILYNANFNAYYKSWEEFKKQTGSMANPVLLKY